MKIQNQLRIVSFIAVLGLAMFGVGCTKYQVPLYAEVKSNETAFAIPLEQGVNAGVAFDSEAYLDSRKVALKRIPIPQRWNSTGYLYLDGDWIPTVRVITVDRTPVTRKWSPGRASKDALWMESEDSIGFSTGISITAFIDEQDTSRFLYSYKAETLSQVLDTEGMARIQSVAAKEAASYKMDLLREKKNELVAKVIEDVVPYFKKKGITVSTIGQFGGFEYENPDIQKAIDNTFVAQQVKVTNAALLAAQGDANLRIQSEALALAEAARSKARGEADGKLSVFTAEADGLRAVNKAISEANQSPMLLELKRIDVEKLRAERWDGRYPQWYMGSGGQSPTMLLNAPSVASIK